MDLRKKLEGLAEKADGRVSYVIASEDGSLDIRRRENDVFPAASIIKLSILWSVFRKASRGETLLTEEMPVHAGDFTDGYGVLKGLHAGLLPTVEDLCVLMTVCSDNVATNMLIDRFGFAAINRDIADCGMADTVLARKMMDAEARARGRDNRTTPHDVLTLLKLYRHAAVIPEEPRSRMLAILRNQCCNNLLSQYMPPEFRFAHKTGDVPGTLHDAGLLWNASGREYYVIVMTSDLPDQIRGVEFLNDFGAALFAGLHDA